MAHAKTLTLDQALELLSEVVSQLDTAEVERNFKAKRDEGECDPRPLDDA